MKTLHCALASVLLIALAAGENYARNIRSTAAVLQLSSPPNGAIVNSLSETLVWEKFGTETGYEVQVSTNSGFTSLIFYYTVATGTQVSISRLVDGTTYFWRVRPMWIFLPGAWSAVWNFKCQIPPPEVRLLGPSDGSTVATCTATLAWKQYVLATQYSVQVSKDNSFSFPFYSASNGTATQVSISGLENGATYFWRVQMTYGVFTKSVVWSPTWSFLAQIPPPNPPICLSPINGSIINGFTSTLTLTLKWSAVQDASQYSVEVSNTNQFPKLSPFYRATISGNTQTSVSGIVPGTMYYWRVKAKKICGDWGGWSSASSFRYLYTLIPPTVKP